MDHILYRKQNYRNIKLDAKSIGETVGVLRKDKTLKMVRWAGFIRREKAKNDHRSKPVLMSISRIDGVDLQEGQYVQGCLIGSEVYAIVDSEVAVVNKSQ